jgi:hypothetical protein
MPIHDWTRVTAGTWHDMHLSWISSLQIALNNGILSDEFYAQAQYAIDPADSDQQSGDSTQTEMAYYIAKRRTLTIRNASHDRIVALIQLVSPGNKSNQHDFASFVDKAVECLSRGYHLLLVDLFPPTSRDPNGIHGAIWNEIGSQPYTRPAEEPLTLVAYSAGQPTTAYIEPVVVGREMIEMPLFLKPEMYVNVLLEETYQAAYQGMPRKWKAVLEATATV